MVAVAPVLRVELELEHRVTAVALAPPRQIMAAAAAATGLLAETVMTAPARVAMVELATL